MHPITILSTLPSAGVGAVLALLLTRTDLSVIALIGIILLIGIVKKNADHDDRLRPGCRTQRWQNFARGIHQACVLRFRPILMTTMAALLGTLPLALGTGTGSELRRPLGITIIGGLIVSQTNITDSANGADDGERPINQDPWRRLERIRAVFPERTGHEEVIEPQITRIKSGFNLCYPWFSVSLRPNFLVTSNNVRPPSLQQHAKTR